MLAPVEDERREAEAAFGSARRHTSAPDDARGETALRAAANTPASCRMCSEVGRPAADVPRPPARYAYVPRTRRRDALSDRAPLGSTATRPATSSPAKSTPTTSSRSSRRRSAALFACGSSIRPRSSRAGSGPRRAGQFFVRGACIEAGRKLAVGTPLRIEAGGRASRFAHVCWRKDYRHGLAFQEALAVPAVRRNSRSPSSHSTAKR